MNKRLFFLLVVSVLAIAFIATRNLSFITHFKKVLGISEVSPTVSTSPIYWGAYIDGSTYGKGYGTAPWDSRTLSLFEQHAGKAVSIIQFGLPWYNAKAQPEGYQYFPAKTFDLVRNHGAIPMLAWGSWDYNFGVNQPAFALRNIANGNYLYQGKTFDDFLVAWAKGAKAWGHPFFLRFNWEMNGWWQFPWATATNPETNQTINGNTPQDYVAAWKHVHDIFTQVGATNVTWVWCPNISGGNATVPMSSLYPGDQYVDWTCLDGYNKDVTMTTLPDGHKEMKYWLSFDQVFSGSAYNGNKNSYQEITSIAPSKPLIIGEWASDESGDGGAKKANWITNALGNLGTKYPRIRAIVWFNWNSDRGSSYVIESSSASQQAFAQAINSSYFATNIFQNLPPTVIPGWLQNGTPQPQPSGVPVASPSPRSTCTPIPTCVYSKPACKIAITPDMCPTSQGTPTSSPSPSISPSNTTNIKIISPSIGSNVPENSLIQVSAVGSHDILRVFMYANGVQFCYKTSSYVYTCGWKVPPTKEVQYTLTVKAYLRNGSSVTSDPVLVTSN